MFFVISNLHAKCKHEINPKLEEKYPVVNERVFMTAIISSGNRYALAVESWPSVVTPFPCPR